MCSVQSHCSPEDPEMQLPRVECTFIEGGSVDRLKVWRLLEENLFSPFCCPNASSVCISVSDTPFTASVGFRVCALAVFASQPFTRRRLFLGGAGFSMICGSSSSLPVKQSRTFTLLMLYDFKACFCVSLSDPQLQPQSRPRVLFSALERSWHNCGPSPLE